MNVSHVIHDLSFGPSYPGVHNPLDGSERILHDISGTFKYFLKVGCAGYIDDFILPVGSILGSSAAPCFSWLLPSYIEVYLKKPESDTVY